MAAIDLLTQEDLNRFNAELLNELKELLKPAVNADQKQWLKSAEVRHLLYISAGTLQKLRINGTLRFTKVGSTLYYKRDDINALLEGGFTS
ncbi:helix-turn-helix domain-containing protein [Mucilaginibacter sp. ZT4R22]|uniref:Helix-turn-helix domain-containing protein n=1 Tax=Mucilaginibacter pankratovii TaxID=2772110 RepID=A0ABR7WSR4_9SPHI|nr:helix-turn-helix domain-containing protein [Mucilaginibacter pankratovii]MBD1365354.1 helix-turn-helix domain-containing protein [Mucilaginibacter pankratovii]